MTDKQQHREKRPTLAEMFGQEVRGGKSPLQKYWRKWKNVPKKAKQPPIDYDSLRQSIYEFT